MDPSTNRRFFQKQLAAGAATAMLLAMVESSGDNRPLSSKKPGSFFRFERQMK